MTLTLPPDLTEDSLSAALDDFAAALGAGGRAARGRGGARVPRPVLARERRHVRPGGGRHAGATEQVQEVVRIANRHRVPLWTSWQGRNNGYGGPSPRVGRLGRRLADAT